MLGETVRNLRLTHGLTQVQLAGSAAVSVIDEPVEGSLVWIGRGASQ